MISRTHLSRRAQSGALALALILILSLGAYILLTSTASSKDDTDSLMRMYGETFLTVITGTSIAYQPEGADTSCRLSLTSLLSQYFKRPHATLLCADKTVELGRATEDIITLLVWQYLIQNGLEGKYRLTICNTYQPKECMHLTFPDQGREISLLGNFCQGRNVQGVKTLTIRQATITFALCP